VIQVKCTLTDCLHYHKDPVGGNYCRCSHPDKPSCLDAIRCPLYRLDWSKQADKALAIRERFRHNR